MSELRNDADVIVVGGGLAGLACALGLAGSDLSVAVLEGADRLGGRAASVHDATTGDTVDVGPHIVHNHYGNLLAFARWVGTDARIVWHDNPLLTVTEGAQAVDIRCAGLVPPLHLAPSMLAVPQLSLADKLSSVLASLRAMALDGHAFDALDRITAFDFLRDSGCSPRLIQWFWATASMTIAAVPLEQCSAAALLRFTQQLLGHADLRIGLPAVPLADLLAEPARRLLEHNGDRVHTGARVVAVERCADDAFAVVRDDGLRLRSRFVVFAVPPDALRSIALPAGAAPPRDDLAAFVPSPYICCYLWFDRKVTPCRFWTRSAASRPLNYDWYDLSNIRPGAADAPSLIASNAIYAPRIGPLDDEAIIASTVAELAAFAPAARGARLRHARVHRVPMAIPCARPGVERRRPTTRGPVQRVYFAGDWTATGLPFSMESAVRSGLLAAEAVRFDAECPQTLSHPVPVLRGLTGVLHRAPAVVNSLLGM